MEENFSLDNFLNSIIDLHLAAKDFPKPVQILYQPPLYSSKVQYAQDKTIILSKLLISYISTPHISSSLSNPFADLNISMDFLLSNQTDKSLSITNKKDSNFQRKNQEHFLKTNSNSKRFSNIDVQSIPKVNYPLCHPRSLISDNILIIYSPPETAFPKFFPISQPFPFFDPGPLKYFSSLSEIFNEDSSTNNFNPCIVTTSSQLNEICNNLKKSPFLFCSTEYHRIHSYRPYTCLVILMAPESSTIYLIDILLLRNNDSSLNPLADFFSSQSVKIFFNPIDDLQILFESLGITCFHVLSMKKLLTGFQYKNFPTSKKEAFGKFNAVVDWRIRPLTEEMQQIAMNEVIGLRDLLKKSSSLPNELFINVINDYDQNQKVKKYSFDSNVIAEEMCNNKSELKSKKILLQKLLEYRNNTAMIMNESPNVIISDTLLMDIVTFSPKSDLDLEECIERNNSFKKCIMNKAEVLNIIKEFHK